MILADDKDDNANNALFSKFQTIQSTLFQVYQLARTESTTITDHRLLQLSDNQVPVQWKKLWNGPKAATNYLKAMFVRAITAEQRVSQRMPQSVDLSTIYNADTFFAALKLIAARDYPEDISTTEIELTLRVKGEQDDQGRTREDLNSIVIAPLLIEGGLNFDSRTGMLTKVRVAAGRENKATTATPELILVLSRIKSPANYNSDAGDDDEDEDLAANECIVPLYSNGNRDKLICSFKLPIDSNLRALAVYAALALIIPEQPVDNNNNAKE